MGIHEYGGGGDLNYSDAPKRFSLALESLVPSASLLLFMWHPGYFTNGRFWDRLRRLRALVRLSRLRPCVFLVHEPDEVRVGQSAFEKAAYAIEHTARCALWRRADSILFHTEKEREAFFERYPRARKVPSRLVVHGEAFMTSLTPGTTQASAREQLGMPQVGARFLCIGFLSRHKGFDTAISAFNDANAPGARLLVVGAPMSHGAEGVEHVALLRNLAERNSAVSIDVRSVSDEEFDLHIRAADAVIVPYRSVASSSVVPRCQLLGTPVLASASSGLADQVGPNDHVFQSRDDLRRLVREIANEVSSGS